MRTTVFYARVISVSLLSLDITAVDLAVSLVVRPTPLALHPLWRTRRHVQQLSAVALLLSDKLKAPLTRERHEWARVAAPPRCLMVNHNGAGAASHPHLRCAPLEVVVSAVWAELLGA